MALPQSTAALRGIFTPNLVPLDPHGHIHEAELRRYVDWLIERGVHGLYPNGSTGEFTRFTATERRCIVEIIADQTAGRVPILAGAAEANVTETIDACDYYDSLGVDAVAIVSPIYYKLSDEAVYAYFKEIADRTSVAITLYNIPMFAAPISVETVVRLAGECPTIRGIKDSSGDLPNMMRMISAVRPERPDFSFLTGWEAALMPMLLIGCDGGTNASSGIVPELTRALYDATVSERLDDARELQYELLPLFDAMLYSADFPEGFRAALRLRGFEPGESRQPKTAAERTKIEQLSNRLSQLLSERTGQPPLPDEKTTSFDAATVARIVREVLSSSSRTRTDDR